MARQQVGVAYRVQRLRAPPLQPTMYGLCVSWPRPSPTSPPLRTALGGLPHPDRRVRSCPADATG
eukprot:7186498-Pyramimonas_sp.AAC.1